MCMFLVGLRVKDPSKDRYISIFEKHLNLFPKAVDPKPKTLNRIGYTPPQVCCMRSLVAIEQILRESS